MDNTKNVYVIDIFDNYSNHKYHLIAWSKEAVQIVMDMCFGLNYECVVRKEQRCG